MPRLSIPVGGGANGGTIWGANKSFSPSRLTSGPNATRRPLLGVVRTLIAALLVGERVSKAQERTGVIAAGHARLVGDAVHVAVELPLGGRVDVEGIQVNVAVAVPVAEFPLERARNEHI